MAEKEALDALDIVVLAGGISHERDISLRSGRRVADGLNSLGHRVTVREPDGELLGFLTGSRPDVVWPALHGASGEDGALRALLELTGIPFVGSRTDSSRLAWSKPTAKTIVGRAGVATPDSVTLPKETFRELGANSVLSAVIAGLGMPVVVKPAQGGSAQGVTIVASADELPRAMVDAYTYSEIALIERKVEGVEVSVAVIDSGSGAEALPAVEIEPVDGVYSFDARYNAGETRFYVPARLAPEVGEAVAAAASAAHEALGLRHLSRIDLIVDDAGVPWFLEANVLPGLTETSIMPQAIAASGRDLGEVYAALAVAAIAEG
ncbi:D-alanine--D-alanine ligase [Leifsonia sp. LS1]|uniref:D-alanine--D-alanine ligase family protein n=1 Tax=unclassified Leifsonia TaxID=2663824 RepID=UPI001CBC8756|nr:MULTISPECIES: D-alanine--D-alanine ligase [unclassified Leifsonia]UAJ79532.1 D-alanine--D-alanine ligase [Leifsonia sp. ZF2019]GIT78457.1 D-alanine--D-alanine ligase [Leifsonia sp. LS1]